MSFGSTWSIDTLGSTQCRYDYVSGRVFPRRCYEVWTQKPNSACDAHPQNSPLRESSAECLKKAEERPASEGSPMAAIDGGKLDKAIGWDVVDIKGRFLVFLSGPAKLSATT